MELFFAKFLPFIYAFADGAGTDAGDAQTSTTLNSIISWVAGIGGGIVAIFLIISLVKDGVGMAKGSGDSSILKIISKALFLILIIGLIFVAVKYHTWGNTAKDIANSGLGKINSEINTAWGGTANGG